MKERIYHIIIGLFLITFGIIVIGNIFDLWNIKILFKGWWTLIIIIPSLTSLLFHDDKVGSGFMLSLGILLLLASNDVISYSIMWKILLAILIISIGLSIIISAIRGPKKPKNTLRSVPVYTGIFGEDNEKYDGNDFKGCKCISVFGGVELDLSEAKITKDIYIETVSIFGGVDIKLPSDVKLVVSGINILGGTENKRKNIKETKKSSTVYIKNVCVFGGVEII